MNTLELLDYCLKKRYCFARYMWDNGIEWFVECWVPETQDWIETSHKRLYRAIKDLEECIEETKKDPIL